MFRDPRHRSEGQARVPLPIPFLPSEREVGRRYGFEKGEDVDTHQQTVELLVGRLLSSVWLNQVQETVNIGTHQQTVVVVVVVVVVFFFCFFFGLDVIVAPARIQYLLLLLRSSYPSLSRYRFLDP